MLVNEQYFPDLAPRPCGVHMYAAHNVPEDTQGPMAAGEMLSPTVLASWQRPVPGRRLLLGSLGGAEAYQPPLIRASK